MGKEEVREAKGKMNLTWVDSFSIPNGKGSYVGAVTHAQAGSFNWKDNRSTWDHGLLP